jgi:hypothetical protein
VRPNEAQEVIFVVLFRAFITLVNVLVAFCNSTSSAGSQYLADSSLFSAGAGSAIHSPSDADLALALNSLFPLTTSAIVAAASSHQLDIRVRRSVGGRHRRSDQNPEHL